MITTCSIEGCESPVLAKGLCKRHYYAKRRADVLSGSLPAAPCSVDGCTRPTWAKGLCASHYYSRRMSEIRAEARSVVRECRHCGKPFSGRSPRAVFCSRECKEAARVARAKSDVTDRRTGRTCVVCEQPIPLTMSTKADTCSRACANKYQNAKKQQIREQDRPPRPPCARCGALIPEDRRYGAKFCSPECKKKTYDERWREKAPAYMRRYIYGVTPEQYAGMLEAQDNRCAICRSDDWAGKHGVPNVDHCHDTKQVRELLCDSCNQGLGRFRHDPDRLDAAAAYLRKWLEKPLEG